MVPKKVSGTNPEPQLPTRPRGRPRRSDFPDAVKDLLIEATIKLIALDGSTDVSARAVCDSIGVKFASVNYNFGSWNGLIAQAA